jgi:hypothetical protein
VQRIADRVRWLAAEGRQADTLLVSLGIKRTRVGDLLEGAANSGGGGGRLMQARW